MPVSRSSVRPTTALVLALTAGIVYLLACIVTALRRDDLFAAAGRLAAEPWGWVTIVDLYLGFAVAGGLIVLRERRVGRWLPWLVGLALLGNVVTAIYAIRWLLSARGTGIGTNFKN